MANYFNTLPLREQLAELAKCRFMEMSEFADGVEALKGKKMVVIGCGAQGLNQGLNLRDSGLDVSYALRPEAIAEKRQSWKNATDNGFTVGTYEDLIPTADVVLNLTPDKQHTAVVNAVMPLMKQGACLSYSHGFNIVEEGMQIRDDLTVIMVAPKCPGSEVRAEYVRGFGVPTLIAVHEDNDPKGEGLALAKAYAVGTGGHKAGVLMSSFIAEVKSDLMGEQTILCGMLQTGSILCFDKMVEEGIDAGYASKLIQYGWETITEALKYGGVTNMLDRLSNPAKIKCFDLAEELKVIMTGLEAQLGGMGVAFASSLLGLAGSLIVGLLELFAGHGQNRFYRELEEWLSSFTRVSLSSEEGGSGETGAISGVLDTMTEQMDALQGMFVQSSQARAEVDQKLSALVDAITDMNQRQAQSEGVTAALERVAVGQEALTELMRAHGDSGLDAESRMRLRSIDVQMLRILEEISAGRQESLAELRKDIDLLVKAFARPQGLGRTPRSGHEG